MRLVIGFAIQNRSCVVSRRTVCMYRFILNYIFVAYSNVRFLTVVSEPRLFCTCVDIACIICDMI